MEARMMPMPIEARLFFTKNRRGIAKKEARKAENNS